MAIVQFVLLISLTLCAAKEKDIHFQKDTSSSGISTDVIKALFDRVQVLEAKEKQHDSEIKALKEENRQQQSEIEYLKLDKIRKEKRIRDLEQYTKEQKKHLKRLTLNMHALIKKTKHSSVKLAANRIKAEENAIAGAHKLHHQNYTGKYFVYIDNSFH